MVTQFSGTISSLSLPVVVTCHVPRFGYDKTSGVIPVLVIEYDFGGPDVLLGAITSAVREVNVEVEVPVCSSRHVLRKVMQVWLSGRGVLVAALTYCVLVAANGIGIKFTPTSTVTVPPAAIVLGDAKVRVVWMSAFAEASKKTKSAAARTRAPRETRQHTIQLLGSVFIFPPPKGTKPKATSLLT